MKIFKRLAAVLTAAVIAVTSFAVTASAKSIFDTAKELTSGVKSTGTVARYDELSYKITSSKSGKLKIRLEGNFEAGYFWVYDSNGNVVNLSDKSATRGDISGPKYDDSRNEVDWNETIERLDVTASFPIEKGTYYIKILRTGYYGSSDISITATCPESTTDAKVSYIALTLSKGSSIQLSAVVSPSNSSVTWKSSKKSVATVSSSGKITAKAKGSTIITAKCGSSSKKIKIIVQ